ncbi:MAG: transposase, partial [Natronospirillum sp.]
MTSLSDRRTAVALIQEAHSHGARLKPACGLLGLTLRTYQRWVQTGGIVADKRPMAVRPEPHNKLSKEERQAILAVCNSEPYRSAAPAFIVADLADQGQYLGSESTLYRVLRAHGQMNKRGREQAPQPKKAATTHTATAPNQLWCWDITWLPGPVRGSWFYLYLIMDVFSRKIVGYEVHDAETGEHAADLIEKTFWR